MRIFEIDSTDRLWANLRGINLDVDQDFEMAVNILDLLVQLKSPYRVQQLMPTVDTVMQNLVEIMGANFADDESTSELRKKVSNMLKELNQLKTKI